MFKTNTEHFLNVTQTQLIIAEVRYTYKLVHTDRFHEDDLDKVGTGVTLITACRPGAHHTK